MERVTDEVLRMWLNARDGRNVPEKIRDQVFPQINAMAQELIERRAADLRLILAIPAQEMLFAEYGMEAIDAYNALWELCGRPDTKASKRG